MYLFTVLKPKDWKHDATFDRMSNENYCDGIRRQDVQYTHTEKERENENERHTYTKTSKVKWKWKWKWQQQPNKLLCIIRISVTCACVCVYKCTPTTNIVIITLVASSAAMERNASKLSIPFENALRDLKKILLATEALEKDTLDKRAGEIEPGKRTNNMEKNRQK